MERSSTFTVINESKRLIANEQDETISLRPSSDGSADSPNYSDMEDHSWHSPYASNRGTYDEYDYYNTFKPKIIGVPDLTRYSISDSSDVDLEKGLEDLNLIDLNAHPDLCRHLNTTASHSEKECRICHLALETNQEAGTSIVLGYTCKCDLAGAHKQCAEAWFKIKKNRTCEEYVEFIDQWNEASTYRAKELLAWASLS